MRTRRRLALLLAFPASLLVSAWGCGPSPGDPLPPMDDLYLYSLAVAEKARLKVPRGRPQATLNVARVHQRFGRDDKAIEAFREALAMDPNIGEAYREIGFMLSQRKDRMPEAVEAYQQAIRCAPGTPGAFTRIGLILTHMGKLDDALRALQDEVRAGTADAETHYHLGQAHAQQGRHAEAVDSYGKAVQLAPGMRMAHYSLAQSLRALGKAEEADAAQRRFAEIKAEEDAKAALPDPDPSGRKKHLRFASEGWLDAASLFADEANATGDAAAREPFAREHVLAVAEAIRVDPSSVDARRLQVEHYRAKGDLPTAARLCEEAFAAVKEKDQLATSAYNLAGNLIEKAGEGDAGRASLDAALRLLRLAAEGSPGMPEAHREIAKLILFRLKSPRELVPVALRHAQEAVKLDRGPRSYDILAFAYTQAGRVDLGRQTLEEGLRQNPDDAELRNRLQSIDARLRSGGEP